MLELTSLLCVAGSLIQVQESHKKAILSFAGLGIKPYERKECLRHCVLFSGLLLIATKSSNGKLHLPKVRCLPTHLIKSKRPGTSSTILIKFLLSIINHSFLKLLNKYLGKVWARYWTISN